MPGGARAGGRREGGRLDDQEGARRHDRSELSVSARCRQPEYSCVVGEWGTAQQDLFGISSDLPTGLVYRPDFLTADEEGALVAQMAALPFRPSRSHVSGAVAT